MLSYSKFKTQPLQILVERGPEKHQHVKNVESQEKDIRKASAPQLAVDSSSDPFLLFNHQLPVDSIFCYTWTEDIRKYFAKKHSCS